MRGHILPTNRIAGTTKMEAATTTTPACLPRRQEVVSYKCIKISPSVVEVYLPVVQKRQLFYTYFAYVFISSGTSLLSRCLVMDYSGFQATCHSIICFLLYFKQFPDMFQHSDAIRRDIHSVNTLVTFARGYCTRLYITFKTLIKKSVNK